MRVFYSRNCQLLCTLWVEKAVYFLGSGSGLVWGSEDWKAGVTGAGRAGDRLGGWPLAGARPEQLSQPANSVLQETEPASHLIHHHHLTLWHPGDSHPRHPRHIVKIVSTSRQWEAGPGHYHQSSSGVTSREWEPETGAGAGEAYLETTCSDMRDCGDCGDWHHHHLITPEPGGGRHLGGREARNIFWQDNKHINTLLGQSRRTGHLAEFLAITRHNSFLTLAPFLCLQDWIFIEFQIDMFCHTRCQMAWLIQDHLS